MSDPASSPTPIPHVDPSIASPTASTASTASTAAPLSPSSTNAKQNRIEEGKRLLGEAKRRGSVVAEQAIAQLHRQGSRVGRELIRDQQSRDRENAVVYVLRGMAKGFLVYSIPISMLSRKPAGFRRGVILGVFVGLVRTFDRLFRYMNRKGATPLPYDLQKKLSPHALAGGLAAFIGVMLDRSLLNSTFVFWCIVRALRCLPLPQIPHGPTVIMCLSAAQILSTWIVTPQDLPGGYRRFLNIHGDQAVKGRRHINKHATRDGLFCANVHVGETCTHYNLRFFKEGLVRAIPVYAPLYLIFFVLGRRFNWPGVKRLIINILQSSVFLATYCTTAYLTGCLFFRSTGLALRRTTLLCHLWTSGLATLIERPSRRPELAAYCLTFAFETIYRRAKNLGMVQSRSWVAALIITVTAAIMMHHHDKQPPVVMKWLFGVV